MMKYTNEELEILEGMENSVAEIVPFDNKSIKMNAMKTIDYLSKKKQISINMKQADLDFLKQRANDIGISYQNIIQALVHNYTIGKFELKI